MLLFLFAEPADICISNSMDDKSIKIVYLVFPLLNYEL